MCMNINFTFMQNSICINDNGFKEFNLHTQTPKFVEISSVAFWLNYYDRRIDLRPLPTHYLLLSEA